MNDTTALQHADTPVLALQTNEVSDMFTTLAGFEAGWKMAGVLCKMQMLPPHFQGEQNRANCMMLLSLANRYRNLGVDPFMVAQQLVPVKNKFGWQGQFVIAVVNASKKYDGDLQFKYEGEGDQYGCTAWTTRKDGKVIEGTKITMAMVKAEGWISNPKWKNMPEQMFMYRAAAFFGRTYAPELLMGMQTSDELVDVMEDVTPKPLSKAAQMQEMIRSKPIPKPLAGTASEPAAVYDHDEIMPDVTAINQPVKMGDIGAPKTSVLDDREEVDRGDGFPF